LYDGAVELAGYTQAAIYSHIEFWIDARLLTWLDDRAAHRTRDAARRDALNLPVAGPCLTPANTPRER
jgi:hypothetical protein